MLIPNLFFVLFLACECAEIVSNEPKSPENSNPSNATAGSISSPPVSEVKPTNPQASSNDTTKLQSQESTEGVSTNTSTSPNVTEKADDAVAISKNLTNTTNSTTSPVTAPVSSLGWFNYWVCCLWKTHHLWRRTHYPWGGYPWYEGRRGGRRRHRQRHYHRRRPYSYWDPYFR